MWIVFGIIFQYSLLLRDRAETDILEPILLGKLLTDFGEFFAESQTADR